MSRSPRPGPLPRDRTTGIFHADAMPAAARTKAETMNFEVDLQQAEAQALPSAGASLRAAHLDRAGVVRLIHAHRT